MNRFYSFLILVIFVSGCEFDKTISPESSPNPESESSQESGATNENLEYLSQFPSKYQRLTIPYLRTLEYQSTKPTVIQELPNGSNYSQDVVSYQSEGLEINALLTQPTAEMPEGGYPAVVFVHGYIPPLSYQTTERYQAYVDYLARNGIVVFKIDLRGHGNSEGEPGGAYYSGDYIVDVLNAYATLADLSYVDKDKIALWGHSMAGNVVMRALAVDTEIPLGIIWSGAVYTYTDMREFRIQDSSYEPSQNPNRGRRDEMYETVGEVAADSRFWSLVAPTNFLDEISAQIEIHHAVNDPVVNIGYSRNLAELLEKAGNSYEFYQYPSGGHDIENPSFGTAMQRTVDSILNL